MREKEVWKEIEPNNATTTKYIMRPYYYDNCTITLKYVHVNFMFNLQHFAIYNVSSAILYRAVGIDLLVVRQNSYCFEAHRVEYSAQAYSYTIRRHATIGSSVKAVKVELNTMRKHTGGGSANTCRIPQF